MMGGTAASPLQDRCRGALLALACGDALGCTVEFAARDSFAPLTGIVGGGHFRLAPGQWTDDTSMALCLADSLVACGGFDAADQMRRYQRWLDHGHWSAQPQCVGIGRTTEAAIRRFAATGQPFSGMPDAPRATNGSVMRLAPVVLRFLPAPGQPLDGLLQHAADSSRTTHGAPQAVQACRLLAHVLARLLQGAPKQACLDGADAVVDDPALLAVARGGFHGKPRHLIDSSGLALATLEAALWSFMHSDTLADALLLAANLGDDADTVAAVTGQLAGAHHGASAIPADWLAVLHRRDEIQGLADALYQAGPASAGW